MLNVISIFSNLSLLRMNWNIWTWSLCPIFTFQAEKHCSWQLQFFWIQEEHVWPTSSPGREWPGSPLWRMGQFKGCRAFITILQHLLFACSLGLDSCIKHLNFKEFEHLIAWVFCMGGQQVPVLLVLPSFLGCLILRVLSGFDRWSASKHWSYSKSILGILKNI